MPCSADSRCEQVYDTLVDAPRIFAASSQFGFDYYERNVDRLAGRLAIESLYGDGARHVVERHGSFEGWARDFVPRFKKRSGLVLYFEVGSVEEGKRLWDVWETAHQM